MGAMTARSWLRGDGGADRVRALFRDGLPVARRHLGSHRRRQRVAASRPARTSPRASTTCRRSTRLRDEQCGDELRALLGEPLDDEGRERARKLVVATDGVDRPIAAAAVFLEQADVALATLPSERLRHGFASLIDFAARGPARVLVARAASAWERRSPRGCSPRRRSASPGGPCRRRARPLAEVPTRAR